MDNTNSWIHLIFVPLIDTTLIGMMQYYKANTMVNPIGILMKLLPLSFSKYIIEYDTGPMELDFPHCLIIVSAACSFPPCFFECPWHGHIFDPLVNN